MVETKLYKQHKEARRKFGVPNCKTGEVIREGYYRKPYTKKNGSRVKGIWIKPTCIKDQGLPGRGYPLRAPKSKKLQKPGKGIGPLKKGVLGKHGYATKLSASERRTALDSAVGEYGAHRVLRRLNAIKTLSKRTNPKVSKKYFQDMKWVRKTFDGQFKSSWKESALFSKN